MTSAFASTRTDAVSVASKIANDPPAPFASELRYPEELDAILLRGMAKNPNDRFGSCKELGQALLDALLANPAAGKNLSEEEKEKLAASTRAWVQGGMAADAKK